MIAQPRDLATAAVKSRRRRVFADRSRARRVVRFVAEAKAAHPCESRVTDADFLRAAERAEAAGDLVKAAYWRAGARLCREFDEGAS